MTLVGLLCQSCWLLLTNLVRSRRLGISLVLFGLFMDLDFVSVHKNAKKQTNRQTSSHKGGKFSTETVVIRSDEGLRLETSAL